MFRDEEKKSVECNALQMIEHKKQNCNINLKQNTKSVYIITIIAVTNLVSCCLTFFIYCMTPCLDTLSCVLTSCIVYVAVILFVVYNFNKIK